MDRASLLEKVGRFPRQPGIYIMKDCEETPIYIGKALDLRARVRSYFRGNSDDRIRIPFMHAHLCDIDIVVTATEEEALILEANYIRTHKPRYNVDLKDDKHYPYLKVTVQELIPKIEIVRRVNRDGAEYFGPWTNAAHMRRVLRMIRDVFKVRTCNKKLPARGIKRPCVNYSIGKCSGVCAGRISQQQYREHVNMCVTFLKGRRTEVRRILKQKMEEAAVQYRYERAARYRDMLKSLAEVENNQNVDLHQPSLNCDAFGVYRDEQNVCVSMLSFNEGVLLSQRSFTFESDRWAMGDARHDNILVRIYRSMPQPPPAEILLPAREGFNPELLKKWIEKQYTSTVHVHVPQRGKKMRIVEMAQKNARTYCQNIAGAHEKRDRALETLARALSLPDAVRVIEAFDISNLGTDNAVAASVRFTDGRPDSTHYRRYSMQHIEGQNDFAMMRDAVQRRLRGLQQKGEPFPDLLLIDGGKGQLSAALQAAETYENAPYILSLAKKEELVFLPGRAHGLCLGENDPARLLLQRIRDEAHRFAVSYHRVQRSRRYNKSELEQIPGVGARRARTLLTCFGSVRKIARAQVEEIASVKGIPVSLATRIKNRLDSEPESTHSEE